LFFIISKLIHFFLQIIETDTETETSVKLIQKVAKNENKKIAIEFTIDDIKFDNKLHNCYIIYSCSEGLFFVQILLIRYKFLFF